MRFMALLEGWGDERKQGTCRVVPGVNGRRAMPAPAAAWTIAVAEAHFGQQGDVLDAAQRALCEAMLDAARAMPRTH